MSLPFSHLTCFCSHVFGCLQAFQQAALLNNNLMPWRSAGPWGRPTQKTLLRPRQCYEGAPVKVLPSSQAWLATNEDTVLVAGDVLPIMNHK